MRQFNSVRLIRVYDITKDVISWRALPDDAEDWPGYAAETMELTFAELEEIWKKYREDHGATNNAGTQAHQGK